MKKIPFIVVVLFFLLVCLKAVLVFMGSIHSGALQDFDVGPNGELVLGYPKVIEVYREGSLDTHFAAPTIRAYRFYIENGTMIIGSSSGKSTVYDIEGNRIGESELAYTTVKSISGSKKAFEDNDGNRYYLEKNYGFKPFEVKCGDETVLREDHKDFLFNGFPFFCFFAVAFVNMLFVVLIIIEKSRA